MYLNIPHQNLKLSCLYEKPTNKTKGIKMVISNKDNKHFICKTCRNQEKHQCINVWQRNCQMNCQCKLSVLGRCLLKCPFWCWVDPRKALLRVRKTCFTCLNMHSGICRLWNGSPFCQNFFLWLRTLKYIPHYTCVISASMHTSPEEQKINNNGNKERQQQ